MSAPPAKRDLWAWARDPKAVGAATIAALLVSMMLIGLELALGRTDRGLELEGAPGFYAVVGLAGAALTLVAGIGLRALLARPAEPEGGGDDPQP